MSSITQTSATSPAPASPNPPASSSSSARNQSTSTSNVQRIRDTKYRHIFPTHSTVRNSSLSSDAETTPRFGGFRNLMLLVIIFSNLRLMIENFRKYGVLICIRCHDYRRDDVKYGLLLYFAVPCQLFAHYLIERGAARRAKAALARLKREGENNIAPTSAMQEKTYHSFDLSWGIIAGLHSFVACSSLFASSAIVYWGIHHPGIGTLCQLHAVIIWLKSISYGLTNRDLREALLRPSSSEPPPEIYNTCPYPRNINFNNLCYFWWAPTLVYQPAYPRTTAIRWGFVCKRISEVIGLSIIIWIASAQYAAPLLRNSLDTIYVLDLVSIAERTMKLSTISLFCWLCGFFALFQSFLNALAEVMTFGDRDFYGEWWNVTSIRSYWTTWNKPVTNFMRRHVYSPLVGHNVPPVVAQIIVFHLSGVLHEMLVGIPTHNVIGLAYIGMMAQIPLIFVTDAVQKLKYIRGKTIGNMIFWMSFCLIGQPLAALGYFFAWQAKYGSVSQHHDSPGPVLQLLMRR